MKITDFSNCEYRELSYNDIFVCALGYESRSHYLLLRNIETRDSSNTLIIFFNDLDKSSLPSTILQRIEIKQIHCVTCSYEEGEKADDVIVEFIDKSTQNNTDKKIHIDYSSMTRTWYCNLPQRIECAPFAANVELFFWYVAGEYPDIYESYPTAGIDCLSIFHGGVLPMIDCQRTHIIALSYDAIRTESILSIVEPEYLVVCYASNAADASKKDEVEYINKDIIRRAAVSVVLPVDNFVFMLSKLNEIIHEQTTNGQVILIPDGPKPIIFVMSLISLLVDIEDAVTCLHVKRNQNISNNKISVIARKNEIFGVKLVFKVE